MKCTVCGKPMRLIAQTGINHNDEPGPADLVIAEMWQCPDEPNPVWIDVREVESA